MVFGLKPQDRSDCHVSDALCSGETVWDENFDMNSPRVQQSFMVNISGPKHIINFSNKLKMSYRPPKPQNLKKKGIDLIAIAC